MFQIFKKHFIVMDINTITIILMIFFRYQSIFFNIQQNNVFSSHRILLFPLLNSHSRNARLGFWGSRVQNCLVNEWRFMWNFEDRIHYDNFSPCFVWRKLKIAVQNRIEKEQIYFREGLILLNFSNVKQSIKTNWKRRIS